MSEGYGAIVMCAIDFIRAINERPRVFRWIFHHVIGRYAWREFRIMTTNFYLIGMDPTFPYSIEDTNYNKMTNADFERAETERLEQKL